MKKTVAMVLSILLVTGNIAGFEINAQDNFVLGDVNQDNTINALDAARVLVASANIGSGQESGLTDTETVLADYNQDGTVNALDASGILVYSAEVGAGLLKETETPSESTTEETTTTTTPESTPSETTTTVVETQPVQQNPVVENNEPEPAPVQQDDNSGGGSSSGGMSQEEYDAWLRSRGLEPDYSNPFDGGGTWDGDFY